MTTKLAFFDVDGTLSVPIFKKDDHFEIGFSEEEWKEYCLIHKEDSYEFCKPVLPIKRYAASLKEQGALLYVLTTSGSSNETLAKEKFIATHFPGLFEEVIAVDADKKKLDVIQAKAKDHNVPLEACELVEDTFATLLYVNEYHIKPTHVAAITCDL